MPRRLQPPSLREASIMNIVSHFDDYWCAGNTSTALEESGQSEVFTTFQCLNCWCAGKSSTPSEDSGQSDTFSPFQYLRDDTIREIIDMLEKRDILRPYHFQVLLHSNIRRFVLFVKHLGRLDQRCYIKPVLKSLGSRCQNLTHVDINLSYNECIEELCTLLANMPRLTSLDISRTDVNADVLKVISENCPNLLDLNMTQCNFVGDTDLLCFCNSPTRHTNLPKLRSLSLPRFRNDPSVDTVVHLLNSHPSLRHLCVPGIDRAFDQMYGEEFQYLKEVPPEWIHKLLDITIFGDSVEELEHRGDIGGELKPIISQVDRLNLTFQCCPFLTQLSLIDLSDKESLIGLADTEIIKNVSNLKHLTNLSVHISGTEICYWTYHSRNFSTHMFPVLTKIGHNLISLECVGFVEVSLITIGKLCPKLESLTLDKNQFTSEHDLMDDYVNNPFPCFKNLNVINISTNVSFYQEPFKSVGKEALSLLFQNATEITEIELNRVQNLTDKVNKIHSFRHLKKCRLTECSISVESVWKLLSADNPLEDLTVRCYQNMTRNDKDLVKQEVKLRQLNINLIC